MKGKAKPKIGIEEFLSIAERFEIGLKIVEALRKEGVPCGTRGPKAGPDWHLASDMLPLREHMPLKDVCPVADDLYNRCIAIGIDQWWTADDCRRIAEAINKALSTSCSEA